MGELLMRKLDKVLRCGNEGDELVVEIRCGKGVIDGKEK